MQEIVTINFILWGKHSDFATNTSNYTIFDTNFENNLSGSIYLSIYDFINVIFSNIFQPSKLFNTPFFPVFRLCSSLFLL